MKRSITVAAFVEGGAAAGLCPADVWCEAPVATVAGWASIAAVAGASGLPSNAPPSFPAEEREPEPPCRDALCGPRIARSLTEIPGRAGEVAPGPGDATGVGELTGVETTGGETTGVTGTCVGVAGVVAVVAVGGLGVAGAVPVWSVP